MADINEPVCLEILETATRLGGRNSHYERRRGDLDGLYRDAQAFATFAGESRDELAYWVDESRVGNGEGALIIGLSVLLPGTVGDEYAMTRGHLHVKSDRAELYYCVGGRGVMLMDNLHGETRAIEITPGRGVHVPGEWVHRTVNVGNVPFSTVFCYGTDAGQDYEIIRKAGGMRELVVTDHAGGWRSVPNDRHKGYRRD